MCLAKHGIAISLGGALTEKMTAGPAPAVIASVSSTLRMWLRLANDCVDKGRGKPVNVRVDGPLIFNTVPPQIDAALAGLGVILPPVDELAGQLSQGTLTRVLEDWCPLFAGYHLYYPSRRQRSPAFALVIKALRLDEAT